MEYGFYTPVIFGRPELAVTEWWRHLPSQRGENQAPSSKRDEKERGTGGIATSQKTTEEKLGESVQRGLLRRKTGLQICICKIAATEQH